MPIRCFVEEEPEEEIEAEIEEPYRPIVPIIWARLPQGYRIQSLEEERFVEALQFVKAHHLNHEVLSKAVDFASDEESVQEFLERSLYDLFDFTSIIAVDIVTDKMVAVMINKRVVNDPDEIIAEREIASAFPSQICTDVEHMIVDAVNGEPEYITRGFPVNGKAMKIVRNFRRTLARESDIHDKIPTTFYLQFQVLTLLRNIPYVKRMADFMLRASLMLADSLQANSAGGIFTSVAGQALAMRNNLINYHEKFYDDHIENFPSENPSAMLMCIVFPPKRVVAIFSKGKDGKSKGKGKDKKGKGKDKKGKAKKK